MAAFIVYSIMCAVYGGILTLVLLPPLWIRYQTWRITRAADTILRQHDKDTV